MTFKQAWCSSLGLHYLSELFESYLISFKFLSLAVQFVNKFTLRSFNRNFNFVEVAITRWAICEQVHIALV